MRRCSNRKAKRICIVNNSTFRPEVIILMLSSFRRMLCTIASIVCKHGSTHLRTCTSSLSNDDFIKEFGLCMIIFVIVLDQRLIASHVMSQIRLGSWSSSKLSAVLIILSSIKHPVILLLWLEVSDLCLWDVLLKWLEVILVSLRILDQVFFYRVVFIFLAIVMTAKKCIEWETIVLETIAIAQVTTDLIVIRVVMTVSLHHSTSSMTWC